MIQTVEILKCSITSTWVKDGQFFLINIGQIRKIEITQPDKINLFITTLFLISSVFKQLCIILYIQRKNTILASK